MQPIRMLLVDDNPIFLDSAARFLTADADLKVVGQATSGDEAVLQVMRLRPQVVVMDVAMPGISGLEITRRVKELQDAPFVVIATMHDHSEIRVAAQSCRADGFVAKSRFCTDLPPLVKALCGKTEAAMNCAPVA